MAAEGTPVVTTLDCDWIPAVRASRKVLVVLHGLGDSSRGFHWLPAALALDELNYLLPNAPDEAMGGRAWYDLPPNQRPGVQRSARLLDRLFGELTDQGFAADDLAILGFSQGALLTLEWGARSRFALGAYVCIAGYCLDPAALLAERNQVVSADRWLVTHGEHDEVLDFDRTRRHMAELAAGGFALRFEAYPKTHTIDPREELPSIREFLAARLGVR